MSSENDSVIENNLELDSVSDTQNKLIKRSKIKLSKEDKKPYKRKVKNDEFVIPTRNNYGVLLSNNYTIKQLKEIAAHYKIKLGSVGVKNEIFSKIYNYFKLYDTALIIQKAWRNYLFKQYNILRGPARFKRSLCVNDCDFFTMDEVADIPYTQFYSYRDIDNMVYGFDIISLYNLFNKGINVPSNPYTRNIFPKHVKKNMYKIKFLGNLFNDKINFNIVEEDNVIVNSNPQQVIETRVISLFHDIDILGNYTNYTWFMNLNQQLLVKFIFEINDIWSYRANLDDEVKRNICPNHRNLFRMILMTDIRYASMMTLYEISLDIMENLVRTGSNNDYRCLGANYVLCALTLVNIETAIALPWLYESVI